jgi:uncharacterized protein
VKIAVVADTHLPRGTRRLPDECLRRLEDAELILHAGDFVAVETLRQLEQLGPVAGVAGNMDEPRLRELLPERRVIEAGGTRIGMVHISGRREGRAERLVALFPSCDAVVYGHTHVAEVTRHGDCWILNPGSPTERRRAPARTMLELAIQEGQLVPRLIRLLDTNRRS